MFTVVNIGELLLHNVWGSNSVGQPDTSNER
jgi:hypothetical protein